LCSNFVVQVLVHWLQLQVIFFYHPWVLVTTFSFHVFFATSFSFCIIVQNPLTWYLNFVVQMMACVEGWNLSSLVAKKWNEKGFAKKP
jgi:hypothetical protein